MGGVARVRLYCCVGVVDFLFGFCESDVGFVRRFVV